MCGNYWKPDKLYLNQFIFVNKKVKTLVKGILLKLEVSPIIILQADYGTASTFSDLEYLTAETVKERITIFKMHIIYLKLEIKFCTIL